MEEGPSGGEDHRCRRRGTPNWRCSERALDGKAFCEKHHLYVVLRNKKKKMEKVAREIGGGGEMGSERKKRKRQKLEDILGNQEVGLGDDSVQEWFGSGNGTAVSVGEEIARLFGEVSDGNGGLGGLEGESLQLWPGGDGQAFGQGVCGNGGQVLGGGGVSEGIQGGYGGLGLDGEAIQLWGSDDACKNGGGVPGGQGIQVEGFGGTACDIEGLILGGGGGIQESYGGNMSGIGGLEDFNGKKVQLWSSANGCENSSGLFGGQGIHGGGSMGNADENDGLGFGTGRFQDLFSKVTGETLVDGRIQALFGETSCGNDGLSFNGEGIQFWCEEAACANLDGKGVQGLFGDNVCVNGGEVGVGNGDRQEVVESKGKRGRPKGSKNKKKSLGTEECIEGLSGVTGENGVRDEVKSEAKQGRPKGPKNKTKSLEMDRNERISGQETACMTALDNERLFQEVENDKRLAEEGAISVNEVRNEIVEPKPKRGRPKGSTNKKKNLSGQQNQGVPGEIVNNNFSDIVAWPTGLENEMLTPVGEKKWKLPVEATRDGEDGDEKTRPKYKLGRPKGSKNKKKISEAQENQGTPCDSVVVNDGGDKTLYPIGGGNDRLPVGNEGGTEIVQQKKKLGRPKGSKNKKKNTAGQENEEIASKMVANNGFDETVWPLELENERQTFIGKEDRGLHLEATYDNEGGDEIVRPNDKPGQPKGLKNMQNILADKENQGMLCKGSNDGSWVETLGPITESYENERPILVSEEDRGMPVEATGGNGGGGTVQSKKRLGRPKGSKNKKKIVADQENEGVTGETIHSKDGGRAETILSMDSQYERPTFVGEEDQGMLFESTVGNGTANEMIRPNDELKGLENMKKRGRPKGSKKKRTIIIGEALKIAKTRQALRDSGDVEIKSNEIISESSSVLKRPRGRPRKFKNKKRNSVGTREGRSTEDGLENSGLPVSYSASISSLYSKYFYLAG